MVLAPTAIWMLRAVPASAQSGIIRKGIAVPGTTNNQPLLPEDSSAAPGVPANPTLEIAPHVIAEPAPAATATPPAAGDNDDSVSDAAGTLDDAIHQNAPKPPTEAGEILPGMKRPYLGLAAQYIETHDPPWRTVQGLEVVSVDHDIPLIALDSKGGER